MKRILTITLILISVSLSYAQFSKNNLIYLTGEFNLGNYVGVDLNLNYIYKEKYSFKIGYTGNIRKPKSQPKDYSPGIELLILPFGLSNPYDQFEDFQIAIGRLYKLNQRGTIRANLSLGMGYTIITELEDWELATIAFLTRNYTWNDKKYNAVSFIINPKIEFLSSKKIGFTISPMLQINKKRTYFGVGIGCMIGLLSKNEL